MTLRATATFGNGQTTGVGSIVIVVPTTGVGGPVVAGDVATLVCMAVSTGGGTMTTPTTAGVAWSKIMGPIQIGASSELVNVYRKTLAAGDIGATVTVTLSTAMRAIAGMTVESAVDVTGAIVPTPVSESSATATPTLPTAAAVPSGSTVHAFLARRNGVAGAAVVGLPSGFTQTINIATTYGSAAEATLVMGRLVASTTGSYGGTSGTSSPNTGGVNGVQALPAAAAPPVTQNAGPDQVGKEPGELVTLTGTGDTWTQISGSPTVTLTTVSPTVRTFIAPATLAGVTLGFRNSQTGTTPDDMTVAVLLAPERVNVSSAWVASRGKFA